MTEEPPDPAETMAVAVEAWGLYTTMPPHVRQRRTSVLLGLLARYYIAEHASQPIDGELLYSLGFRGGSGTDWYLHLRGGGEITMRPDGTWAVCGCDIPMPLGGYDLANLLDSLGADPSLRSPLEVV